MTIDQRDAWDLDFTVAHLNHGSFGAVPRRVGAEQRRWRAEAERNPTGFHWRRLPGLMDAVRHRVAEFAGTDPTRCVLMPNVTVGMATALASVPLRQDDEVALTADTYPGVRAAAELACVRAGARVVVVPLPAGDLAPATMTTAVLNAVGPRTRLAIVDHITSPTAILVEVGRLTAALRERGVIVAVDGAHAPGAVEVGVDAIGADFYVGNFHKWCCAPRGSAFLAVSETARDGLVAAIAGSRAAEGFPAGLEWWGTADYSAILSTPAALGLLEELGWPDVHWHNRELVDAGSRLVEAALRLPPGAPPAVPMKAVPLPGVDDLSSVIRLREQLAARGIEVAVAHVRGHGWLRLSAHLYNRLEDYERLGRTLADLGGAPTG